MHFIFTSYTSSPEFSCPNAWLKRIDFYTGILEKLAQTHTVTAIEHINYSGELRQNGVRYLFRSLKKKVSRFPFGKHQLMKKMGPDVVFINGFIFPWQIIQLRLQLGKSPRIIILHRAEKPFSGYKRIIQKIADKFVSAYFFSSFEFGQTWIRKGIVDDEKKIHEILQSSSIFAPTGKKQDKSKAAYAEAYNFLWVGRLDKNKDPLTVVSAFIEFLELVPLAKLQLIYQDGDLLSEIESKINATQKSRQSIKLVGAVPHHELGEYFNAADFIVSGSHYEGSGISVIEAMSCGCIPVVTNIPSFRKMTNNGEFGILYEAGNKSSLLDALLKAIRPDLDTQREAVRLHFERELSFDAIAKKTNEVVLQLFR
ncbi:glycosyltransferase family 4 protein [Flavitalea sp.]|nr:glycosyltransferase family 4 protein [Flavitalea sp.]